MSESENHPFTILAGSGTFEVSSPFVQLASAGEPINFSIVLQKEITPVRSGMIVEEVEFDRDNPALADIWEQIDRIKKSRRIKRPRQVMELLRSRVQYAYPWNLEALNQEDPIKADWVKDNIAIEGWKSRPLRLSDIINPGFAVCRHMAASYLYLAHEAGLEISFQNNAPDSVPGGSPGPIVNVLRRDNNQPLFKMSKVGDPIWAGHAWTEVKIGQDWMSVDPTTQLVGDNEAERQTFLDANYKANIGNSIEFNEEPGNIGYSVPDNNLDFPVFQSQHRGIFSVNSVVKQKPSTLTRDPEKLAEFKKRVERQEWPQPTQFSGGLRFIVKSHKSFNGLNVKVLDVKPIDTP